jgi:enoyl-CoA hydratase/carnithine racemase
MTLRLERDGAIGRLLIDRPEKRNALNQEMWERFPVLIAHAMADRAIRVLVVQSSTPGMFCAGADIGELIAHDLARAGKPTIAFIDGDCVGGGCGIAMACDIRVATPQARFGITPANLGLVYPLHDTKLLVDLVGPGQAKRMLYSAQLIGAEEAQRIGLVEEIDESPNALANLIAAKSAHSTHEMKLMIRRVLDGQCDDDAETKRIFAEAFTKPDFTEGTTAFVEKRKPEFK